MVQTIDTDEIKYSAVWIGNVSGKHLVTLCTSYVVSAAAVDGVSQEIVTKEGGCMPRIHL